MDKDFFTLKVNDLEYVLCDVGASIYSIKYKDELLTLTLKDKEFFKISPQYFGKTLGLIAGRVKNEFSFNNINYKLKETSPGISLHGGNLTSISFERFKHKIKESKNKIDVIFSFSPRKNKNGFNFKINLKIIYSFSKIKNSFSIIFKENIKEESLLNLSNHIYWNLGSDKNINDYYLKFDSPFIGKMRDDLLIIDKEETIDFLNFKRKSKLKPRLDKASKTSVGTIDNTFIFNEKDKVHSCILENDKYSLKVKTNYPAMNIYVDSSLTPVSFLNRDDLKERRGIALEPQLFVLDLNSINFKKGDKYSYFIKYDIKKK